MDTFDNELSVKENESKEQNSMSEEPTLNSFVLDSDVTIKSSFLSKYIPYEKGRTKVICFGIIGILLVLIANLIILGNNVLIKQFGIDYVDMIILRSTVQLIILGLVIKIKGKYSLNPF